MKSARIRPASVRGAARRRHLGTCVPYTRPRHVCTVHAREVYYDCIIELNDGAMIKHCNGTSTSTKAGCGSGAWTWIRWPTKLLAGGAGRWAVCVCGGGGGVPGARVSRRRARLTAPCTAWHRHHPLQDGSRLYAALPFLVSRSRGWLPCPLVNGWRVDGRVGRPALAMGEKTGGAAQRRCALRVPTVPRTCVIYTCRQISWIVIRWSYANETPQRRKLHF